MAAMVSGLVPVDGVEVEEEGGKVTVVGTTLVSVPATDVCSAAAAGFEMA